MRGTTRTAQQVLRRRWLGVGVSYSRTSSSSSSSRSRTRLFSSATNNEGGDLNHNHDHNHNNIFDSTNTLLLGGFSRSSLGLEHSLVRPVAASIRQLPEVDAAMAKGNGNGNGNGNADNPPSQSTIDDLKRALDVFASFDKGGREHLGVQALLAEYQQRLGLYDDAILSLGELRESLKENAKARSTNQYLHLEEDALLALAKVFWTRGDFASAQELCEDILSTYDDLGESFPSTNLHVASAMSGKALSQLTSMNSMDDSISYSVRDFFRVTIRFLERQPPSPLLRVPSAVALSNAGLAEVIYAMYLREKTHHNVAVPITPALKYLFRGLQQTTSSTMRATTAATPNHVVAASHSIEASIQANLAWGVLNYEDDDEDEDDDDDRSDRLTKASGYAKKALEFYNADSVLGREGLSRVLSVVAACYRDAGSAVTAEGLLQSATSGTGTGTDASYHTSASATLAQKLQLLDACREYAGLCEDWDKRNRDAENLRARADTVESSLPVAWRGKPAPGIHGSLWFWTPGEFL